MCSGSEAGSYLRLIDSCITRLKAANLSTICNESTKEEEAHPPCLVSNESKCPLDTPQLVDGRSLQSPAVRLVVITIRASQRRTPPTPQRTSIGLIE